MEDTAVGPGKQPFQTTRWSLILSISDSEAPSQTARDALAQLCQIYWRPIFAFLCRRGYSISDAEDLTQGFFLSVLEGQLLKRADPERGRFRTLLLKGLNDFLKDEHRKRSARKRGGDVQFVSWDEMAAEAPSRLSIPEEALTSWPAERIFDLRWAATVVERALQRLAAECERHGRRRVFDALSQYLAADREDVSYAQISKKLGVPETGMKELMRSFRKQYRILLREEVADTVENAESIDEEVRYLCATLAASAK